MKILDDINIVSLHKTFEKIIIGSIDNFLYDFFTNIRVSLYNEIGDIIGIYDISDDIFVILSENYKYTDIIY